MTGLAQACPFKDAVVLVQAKAGGDAAWRVVGDAVADSQGNFSMPYPYGTYVAAQALVSLTPNSPVDIPIVQGVPNETIAPDFLYLLVSDPVCDEPAADQKKDCDCDCQEKNGTAKAATAANRIRTAMAPALLRRIAFFTSVLLSGQVALYC